LRIERWTTHEARLSSAILARAEASKVLSLGRLDHPAIDSNGRTIWIADAHREDGKRFVVQSDEKLTAFPELESMIRPCGELV
jgi:hypothetical protein